MLPQGRRTAGRRGYQSFKRLYGGAQTHRRSRPPGYQPAGGSVGSAERRCLMPKVAFLQPDGVRREIEAPLSTAWWLRCRANKAAERARPRESIGLRIVRLAENIDCYTSGRRSDAGHVRLSIAWRRGYPSPLGHE